MYWLSLPYAVCQSACFQTSAPTLFVSYGCCDTWPQTWWQNMSLSSYSSRGQKSKTGLTGLTSGGVWCCVFSGGSRGESIPCIFHLLEALTFLGSQPLPPSAEPKRWLSPLTYSDFIPSSLSFSDSDSPASFHISGPLWWHWHSWEVQGTLPVLKSGD